MDLLFVKQIQFHVKIMVKAGAPELDNCGACMDILDFILFSFWDRELKFIGRLCKKADTENLQDGTFG